MASHVVVRALPFATKFPKRHAKDILASDRARAKKLLRGCQPHGPAAFKQRTTLTGDRQVLAKASDTDDSVPVTDATVTYTLNVGVGSPATEYTLLIDTGSSNTWLGADKEYTKTSTSKSTGHSFNVSYGSGRVSGTEYTDQVTLGEDLVIKKQSIGVASTAQGFNDVDGILGIGPVDLTQGTVASTSSVPTVTDNLYEQGTIPTESIGIFYQPTTSSTSVANGELTFGGTDDDRFTGQIVYSPITSTSPASNYWGIDQTVTYGESTAIMNSLAGIVDTGTTLLLIATDAFQAYQKAAGASLDDSTGLLTITEAQYDSLKSLFFQIGDTTFEFTPNAQIWPRNLNSLLGGEEGKIYLITSDMGSKSGQGLDFIGKPQSHLPCRDAFNGTGRRFCLPATLLFW
ncbi:acid protease [Schizophyllum fasciatum]